MLLIYTAEVFMQIRLTGKTAIVTGSSGGIGLAIGKALALAGASVVLTGRNEKTLQQQVNIITAEHSQCQIRYHAVDLSTADGCQELTAREPKADILVNNLGIYGAKPFFELTDDDWLTIFHINVLSAIRLAKHYAQGMKDNGWGRIEFISSESAINIPSDMVHYGVSKAALQAAARGLAKVLAGSGVTVNSILPGPTLTEGTEAFIGKMAEERGVTLEEMQTLFLNENRPSTLMTRFARPEEVANLCVYVASEQASYTTGAALRVEGGIVETSF